MFLKWNLFSQLKLVTILNPLHLLQPQLFMIQLKYNIFLMNSIFWFPNLVMCAKYCIFEQLYFCSISGHYFGGSRMNVGSQIDRHYFFYLFTIINQPNPLVHSLQLRFLIKVSFFSFNLAEYSFNYFSTKLRFGFDSTSSNG